MYVTCAQCEPAFVKSTGRQWRICQSRCSLANAKHPARCWAVNATPTCGFAAYQDTKKLQTNLSCTLTLETKSQSLLFEDSISVYAALHAISVYEELHAISVYAKLHAISVYAELHAIINILYIVPPLHCFLHADWCYQSQVSCEQPCKGPAAWNEVNAVCGGNKQSPINIVTKKTKKESSLTAFKFTGYSQPFTSTLKNNGQTVYLDIPSGATLSGGNLSNTYNAVQLDFHWGSSSSPGSEHTLDGEHYPMELHILHIKNKYLTVDEALNDVTGQAILGFFFEESATENTEYSTFIAAVTKVQDAESHTDLNISLNTLILSEMKLRDYYRYEGSQTIPGCSESAIWTMFKEPIPLSKAQLAAFFDLKSKDGKPLVNTFRPVQPRKGRVVYRSHSGAAESVVVLSFTLVLLSVSTTLSCNQLY
ncbi:carbonic anhydrase 4-like [Tachysurus vachellii]|uniref:carbonic anhydrase 4-like n=1 Tax=Tachysurus vachellii TaxID=175792 RepID=UPI00296AED15|nr:carbonic anhydrase 4-like [Tachysurus vachellii]